MGLGRPAGRQGSGRRGVRQGARVCTPGARCPHTGSHAGHSAGAGPLLFVERWPRRQRGPRRCLWNNLIDQLAALLRESAVLNQELTVCVRLVALDSKL